MTVLFLLFLCRYRVAADRALEVRPAVVATCEAVIDFLPGLLFDVVYKDPARVGLDVEARRVPEPQRLNSLATARGMCVERVVRGDRTVLVYPEPLAEGST